MYDNTTTTTSHCVLLYVSAPLEKPKLGGMPWGGGQTIEKWAIGPDIVGLHAIGLLLGGAHVEDFYHGVGPEVHIMRQCLADLAVRGAAMAGHAPFQWLARLSNVAVVRRVVHDAVDGSFGTLGSLGGRLSSRRRGARGAAGRCGCGRCSRKRGNRGGDLVVLVAQLLLGLFHVSGLRKIQPA